MPDPMPWVRLYPDGVDAGGAKFAPAASVVSVWADRVAADPQGVAVRYFDRSLTAAEVDALANAVAQGLLDRGVRAGDRVGLRMQNIPQYPVTLLALWKIGAAALLVNPMYKDQELLHLVNDSDAIGMVVDGGDAATIEQVVSGTSVRWVLSVDSRQFQTRDDDRVLATVGDDTRTAPDRWSTLVDAHRDAGPPAVAAPDLTSLALLTYTSGTTGTPKGAMNSHGNVLAVTSSYAAWISLGPDDVVFAIAPLFHITGAVINATMALLSGATLSLAHRFHAEVVLETFVEHRVTFTIGSITAFNALSAHPAADRRHFAGVRYLYSGGAPIPPATVERFEQRFGHYIYNVYGMTETTSAVIAVPPGRRAPIHGPSNTLSIGVPMSGTVARVVDVAGAPVAVGEQGELELSGPAVVAGYWHNAQATATTMPGGRLRTGDVAIMDDEGWVFLVDRLKDQINVSGYKVWPREVEDAIYEHPAIHEAAVVGVPDDYQGERVVAYVAVKQGASVTGDEIVAHVRARLAAYKVPKEVFFMDDLPKTATGKIRRTELRARTR